jgi:hypothetical protein
VLLARNRFRNVEGMTVMLLCPCRPLAVSGDAQVRMCLVGPGRAREFRHNSLLVPRKSVNGHMPRGDPVR